MRRLVALLAVLVLVAGAGATAWLAARLREPFQGYVGPEQFVDIPAGSSSTDIARRLMDAGVVRDLLTFRVALWRSQHARTLKAGEYRFDRPMRAADVIEKLAKGEIYERLITFPEGLTIREMSAIFESRGFGPASTFIEAAGEKALISALDPLATDLEGYLFPDTYSLPRRAGASRLVGMMVERFRGAFSDDLRSEARQQSRTIREIVTLASIVEKETARAEERALVASVYRNRLKIGMGLQCDPTVIYGLQRAGRYDGNLTHEDLGFDSPYNTYKYAGLPPSPIASPGRASLEAALRPAASEYLYFVSRNDGTHVFARTLDEHNRNVHEYQIQYFREKRLRESASR